MASRELPGMALQGFAPRYEADWDTWTNANWLKISSLLQARAISAVTSLPGSPTDGDVYIVPTGDPNAEDVAVRDNGAWTYFTPDEGWRIYVEDENLDRVFDGTSWSPNVRHGNVTLSPAASVTPENNGDVTFELTGNTSLTIKAKGSDGAVRSVVLTLAE